MNEKECDVCNNYFEEKQLQNISQKLKCCNLCYNRIKFGLTKKDKNLSTATKESITYLRSLYLKKKKLWDKDQIQTKLKQELSRTTIKGIKNHPKTLCLICGTKENLKPIIPEYAKDFNDKEKKKCSLSVCVTCKKDL